MAPVTSTVVVARRRQATCLDQAPQFDYELAAPVTEEVMSRLAGEARLQYFPRFPKPYFRIERPRGVVVTGLVGETRLHVAFSRSDFGEEERELLRLVACECA